MANDPVKETNRPAVWWLALLLGLFLTGTSLVDLGAQLIYSMRGVPTTGKVVEFHKSSARSATVNGVVVVTLPDAAPFKWEVEDTFGTADWQDGGTVPLLCAQLHADHTSCVLDSPADRCGIALLLLLVGLSLVWASVKMLRRPHPTGPDVVITAARPPS